MNILFKIFIILYVMVICTSCNTVPPDDYYLDTTPNSNGENWK